MNHVVKNNLEFEKKSLERVIIQSRKIIYYDDQSSFGNLEVVKDIDALFEKEKTEFDKSSCNEYKSYISDNTNKKDYKLDGDNNSFKTVKTSDVNLDMLRKSNDCLKKLFNDYFDKFIKKGIITKTNIDFEWMLFARIFTEEKNNYLKRNKILFLKSISSQAFTRYLVEYNIKRDEIYAKDMGILFSSELSQMIKNN